MLHAGPYPASMPTAARIDASPEQLAKVTFNADGLVAAIAQDVDTARGADDGVDERRVAARTLDEGRMVYW